MPVLVTDADAPVGAAIVRRLLLDGGEVRAYCTGDGPAAPSLRQAGAHVAIGDLDDEGRLDAAMAQVHTVVHAVDPVLAPSLGLVARAGRSAVAAAAAAGVRRLILLSLVGAAADAEDPLRRAMATIEVAAAGAEPPSVVLRCSLIDHPVLREALASVRLDPADLGRVVAPVAIDDLAEVVTAFDAARGTARRGHAVFAVCGRPWPLGRYLDAVGVGTGRSRVGRVYRPRQAHPLIEHALAGPLDAAGPDVADAWAFAGLRPRPVPAA